MLRHRVTPGDARVPRRRGLRRRRDAGADPLDARGRPRLPRPQPPAAGLLLRAAAVAAAVQAAADGGRASSATTRWRAASATRRPGPTARPSSPSSTSRCPSSTARTSSRSTNGCWPTSSSAPAARRSSCRCSACAYDEAMGRFGTDRPDLRFGLELVDLGDALRETEFKVFRSVLDGGGAIRGINAGRREMPRSELDGLISRAQELGAKGLVWAFREGDGWRSPTAKFLSEAELADLNQRLGAEEGDLLLLVADERTVDRRGARADAARPGRALRADRRGRPPPGLDRRLAADGVERGGEALGLAAPPVHGAGGRVRPREPGRGPGAQAYDVVWNGQELGGGSIRIHDAEIQQQVFAALGIDAETAEARFGFLLEALRYGAPPHGGIAYGVDRIVQRLSGAETIRDVIAFPKTASGFDLLIGAPAPVDDAPAARARRSRIHQRKLPATEMGLPGLASTQVAPGSRPRPDAGLRRRPQLRQLGGGARLRRRADGARLAPGADRGRHRGGADRRLAARPLRPRRHRPARPGRSLERSRVASLQPRLRTNKKAPTRRCRLWL